MGDKLRIGFKYERLEELCFRCGILGHEAKSYVKEKPLKQWEAPYRVWLKAGYRKNDNTGLGRGPGVGWHTSSPRGGAQLDEQHRTRDPPMFTPHASINGAIIGMPRKAHTQLETSNFLETNNDVFPNRPMNDLSILGLALPDKETDTNKDATSMQRVVHLDSNTSLISVPINYVSNNYSQFNVIDMARGVDHETTIQKHENSEKGMWKRLNRVSNPNKQNKLNDPISIGSKRGYIGTEANNENGRIVGGGGGKSKKLDGQNT